MLVRDIMSAEVACCTPGTSLRQVAELMVECDCGSIPVVADEQSRRLVGMITDRDIVCRALAKGRNPLEMTAQDCMSSEDIACVTPDSQIDECSRLMEEYQVRRLPVVDEHNCVCGIIAQADIARHAPEDKTAELVKEVSQPA